MFGHAIMVEIIWLKRREAACPSSCVKEPFIVLQLALPCTLFSATLKTNCGCFSTSLTGLPFTETISQAPFRSFTDTSATSRFCNNITGLPSASFSATSSPTVSYPATLFNASSTFCSNVISGHIIRVAATWPNFTFPAFRVSNSKLPIRRLHPALPYKRCPSLSKPKNGAFSALTFSPFTSTIFHSPVKSTTATEFFPVPQLISAQAKAAAAKYFLFITCFSFLILITNSQTIHF